MATDHNFKVKNGLTVQGETLVVNHTGDLSGTQVYIKRKDSSTNLMRWGEGTSGVSTYKWRIDQSYEFIGSNGSDVIVLKSSDGSIQGQSYKIGSTTIIDSSRNLSNIGTLSSGVHTITSSGTIGGATIANGYLKVTDGTDTLGIDPNEIMSSDRLFLNSADGEIFLRGNNSAGVKLFNGGTQFMSADRNLSSIGTISSGAITASGPVSITGNASYVGNYGYNTLVLQDTSGYPGINFRHGNKNWLVRKNGPNDDLEFVYSDNASAQDTGTYTERLKILHDGGFDFKNGAFSNVGTISSGAITSTGKFTQDANGAVNSIHIHDDDTSGQPGIHITNALTGYNKEFYVKTYNSGISGTFFGASASNKSIIATAGAADTGLLIGTFSAQSVIIGAGNSAKITIPNSGAINFHSQSLTSIGTISSGNITTTGYLRGPSTFTIDPAAHGDDTGTVVIAGNLQVDGTTTTINSTTVTLDDKNIVLASGAANGAAANGAGITIDGVNATLTYDNGDGNWLFNKALHMVGTQRITTAGFAGIEYHNTDGTWELFVGTENNTGNARYNSRQGSHKFYSNGTEIAHLNSAGLTLDGGTSTTLNVKCDDAGLALIRANGDGQGTGAIEVGQSNTYGGGMFYNGDGSPNFANGETDDHIGFYRLDNGTRTEVFHYPYSSNVVNFNATPTAQGNTIWHAGNDGASSGLDADTLDTLHASSFVRNDISNAINLTITGVMQANNGYKVGSSTVIDSSRLVQNVDLKAGNSGVRLKNDNWFYDTASNERIYFHSSNNYYKTASSSGRHVWRVGGDTQVMEVDSDGDLTIPGKLTSTTIKETDGGDGFTEIGTSDFGYFSWGIEIANPNSGYRAIRFAGKKKYFVLEADVLGTSGANHTGMFWGNADGTAILGGSTTGYKTTHQNSTSFHIRAINNNSNQETYNPGFSPADGAWHHQKIMATPDGYVRIWIDGDLKFEETGYIPSAEGYLGFLNYAGTVRFANIRCRTINEDEAQHYSQHIGNATSAYADDDRFLKLANNTANSTGTLVTADNGNTWLNADGGKDLWLNWVSLNNKSSKASLQVGDGNYGAAILTVSGSLGRVGINNYNPTYDLDVIGDVGVTNGSLNLSSGYNIQWGGAYTSGFPSIFANSTQKVLRFAPNGSTTGTVLEIDSGGLDLKVGGYEINGTTVIDSSRNITGQSVLVNNGLTVRNGNTNAALHFSTGNDFCGIGFNRNVATGSIFDSTINAFQMQIQNNVLEIEAYNGSGTNVSNNTWTLDTSGNMTTRGLVIAGNAYSPTGSVIGNVRSYGSTNAYMGASDQAGRTAFFGVDTSGYAMFGSLTNHDVVIRTNNAERVRVATNGNMTFKGDTFTFHGSGTDTYTTSALYINQTYGVLLEGSLQSNASGGVKNPLVFTWRGNWNTQGGVKVEAGKTTVDSLCIKSGNNSTTVIDSSRNLLNLNGSIKSDTVFAFLTNADAAQDVRTKSVFAGTSYGDTPPAGSFNATNTYELNGTTVIDSSRNVFGVNGSFTGYAAIGSRIGTISPSLSVTGATSSVPFLAKSGSYSTVFSVLPWSDAITYLASGTYYQGGSWVHASPNDYECLLGISGNTGGRWYATTNGQGGSWNHASNVQLWNNSGVWTSGVDTSGLVDAASGFRVNGTTVIDASRNIFPVNIHFGGATNQSFINGGSNIALYADNVLTMHTYASGWVERARVTDSGFMLKGSSKIEYELSSGTLISHGAYSDAIGYNASYGTYVGAGGRYVYSGTASAGNSGSHPYYHNGSIVAHITHDAGQINNSYNGDHTFTNTTASGGIKVTNNQSGGPAIKIHSTATGGTDWWLISNNTNNTNGAGHLQLWNNTNGFTAATIGYTASTATNLYNQKVLLRGSNIGIGLGARPPGSVASFGGGDNNGIFWHSDSGNDYGIYREAGSWTDPYRPLIIRWPVGIKLDADDSDVTILSNVTIDATGSSSRLDMLCANAGNSTLNLMGATGGQGTGVLFVGQSPEYGGGIEYNGDNNPATSGAGADFVTLFRRENSTNYWTAKNNYASNDWQFRGDVTAYASDERLKENITPISNAISKVKQLQGVEFDWKSDCLEKGFMPSLQHETGVIAQNVQKVIPDAVSPAPFDNDYLTVQKDKIVPVLIEAIKEQQEKIEKLEELVQKLISEK